MSKSRDEPPYNPLELWFPREAPGPSTAGRRRKTDSRRVSPPATRVLTASRPLLSQPSPHVSPSRGAHDMKDEWAGVRTQVSERAKPSVCALPSARVVAFPISGTDAATPPNSRYDGVALLLANTLATMKRTPRSVHRCSKRMERMRARLAVDAAVSAKREPAAIARSLLDRTCAACGMCEPRSDI